MPGYKRGSYKKSAKRALTKKYGAPKKVVPAVRTLQAAVRRLNVKMNKTIETKQSVYTAPDSIEISHNNFITIVNGNLLQTTQGITDPRTTNTANRIGDSIFLKGVSLKMMLELNSRYSDVTFRLLVVKTARGVTLDRATLFNGLSGNKMIDTLNTERYTIIAQKFFKMKAPNYGSAVDDGAGGIPQPSGYGQVAASTYSRATKIVKLWLPGTKFSKSGKITYEDGSSQVKFFDYHVLLYAYSNYTTLQDLWNVARLNDYVQVMYYQDA